jgi:hypothetical protein
MPSKNHKRSMMGSICTLVRYSRSIEESQDRQTRSQSSTEAPILWQHNILDSYTTVGRIVYRNKSGTAGV